MGVGALCHVSYGMIAPHLTTGKMLIDMFNDIDNSELIIVWGANPATDLPPVEMKKIMEAKSRGAEVVVIDPRRTMTTKLSEAQWIPIRPGTDGALALGMCNVLIEEELYDEVFVENWILGFEEFSSYVQHFRPDVVERITGIPGKDVTALSRRIAQARGVSQLMYTGMEFSTSGVQAIRASLTLWALAGHLDVPGGRCFHMPQNHFPVNREDHIKNPGDINKRIGGDRFPVYIKYRDEAHAISLPESVLEGKPYSIDALIILGGSIITSWPNPEIWKKTLSSLDFLVTIDRRFTADADIVLPACTYYEIESYMRYGSLFKIRERLIGPLGESRSDVFILSELAEKYPLVFNSGGRFRTGINAQYHDIKGLNSHHPEPLVTINTLDAEKRGINNGDMVYIKSPMGSVEMRSFVTEDIAPGSIDANHRCGNPEAPPEWRDVNINELTDIEQYDPISGFPVYKSLLCEIEKAGESTGTKVLHSDEISEKELDLKKQDTRSRLVYLDHNATAPLNDSVKEVMNETLELFGNPSSIHSAGRKSLTVIDNARRRIANSLNCTARRIVFTGSGSEANNLAIKGLLSSINKSQCHIITSQIEHLSVLNTCKTLEDSGHKVTYLPVDARGIGNPDDLKSSITKTTDIVSIMFANNETGVIQPIEELIKITHDHGAVFHCDAVQAFGKIPINTAELNTDFMTISGHKIFGPKGIGVLY